VIPDHRRSILAVDPTTYGLAFVAFERGEILDWGHRYERQEKATLVDLVDQVIDGIAADILVLEDPDDLGCRRRPRQRAFLRTLAAHARKRGIAVTLVSRSEIRQAWSERGVTTKQATAAVIGEIFPELAAYVPPPRKISATEDGRVNLFDAASLALHAYPELAP
jgi:hypothetical protein